jgi:hypothetical protein
MQYGFDAARKSASRLVRGCVAAGVLATFAAGCASNIEEGVGPPSTVPSITGSGPKNTGTYPNLNIRPQAAAPQLSPAEQEATLAGLQSSGNRAKAGANVDTMSPEDLERLRRLQADQGNEVLSEIEGK